MSKQSRKLSKLKRLMYNAHSEIDAAFYDSQGKGRYEDALKKYTLATAKYENELKKQNTI